MKADVDGRAEVDTAIERGEADGNKWLLGQASQQDVRSSNTSTIEMKTKYQTARGRRRRGCGAVHRKPTSTASSCQTPRRLQLALLHTAGKAVPSRSDRQRHSHRNHPKPRDLACTQPTSTSCTLSRPPLAAPQPLPSAITRSQLGRGSMA